MSTTHPYSSLEGNRQPMIMSSDSISLCVSLWISGEMVTCPIPYSSKQRCKYRSVFPHCSNDVPRGTQTWSEPNMTLLFDLNKVRIWVKWEKSKMTYDWDRCQTWRSWTESTLGIWCASSARHTMWHYMIRTYRQKVFFNLGKIKMNRWSL
jgi:hypothetical protein